MSGDRPIRDSQLTLYATGGAEGPRVLGQTRTNIRGSFAIDYDDDLANREIRYLIADGGKVGTPGRANPTIRLATVLGRNAPVDVVLNERTTVATAYAMAQFLNGSDLDGTFPGLQNAGATVRNLVTVRSGDVGRVLGQPPNGNRTSTMPTFNSLANLLAGCVRSQETCATLFDLATPRGGVAPSDTLETAQNIARNPALRVWRLFRESLRTDVYGPALVPRQRPDAWTLAIRYDGGGGQLNGPGAVAFDRRGNVWITNNYVFSLNPRGRVCGDDHVLKFTPTGRNFSGAPYRGGGLYGAGFGITLDRRGEVWVGNFGFQGTTCPIPEEEQAELAKSVSQFARDGTAISPDTTPRKPGGWRGSQGTILRPQATAADRDGNIWIASCGGDNVTFFRGGDPTQDQAFTARRLKKPFGLAINRDGLAWVSSNKTNSVFAFDSNGNVVHRLTGDDAAAAGVFLPLGVATDSLGNVWVSNSGLLREPCYKLSGSARFESIRKTLAPGFSGENASVTMIRSDGTAHPRSPLRGAGLIVPWGIAVDGNNNVWVANFAGQRLSHLCGADTSKCPAGKRRVGASISPRNGYGSDALVRNTHVAIDPSGNVWLTNNWRTIANQTNPGGHEMVVFVGLAKPVRTPLIGPPEQP